MEGRFTTTDSEFTRFEGHRSLGSGHHEGSFVVKQAEMTSAACVWTPGHTSESVDPSPEPVDGWRCTTKQAIMAATATIASAMNGNSL